MDKCLFCKEALHQTEGKKEKQFCNGNCRNKYYYKLKTAGKPQKQIGRPPKKKVPEPDRKKSTFHKKTVSSKSDIPTKSEQIPSEGKKPENLTELKAMCPANLTGFDRSDWIAKKRQEFGI